MTPIFDLPHAEARARCERGAIVYLPVNPVEYHGPHLSLHNDLLVSHGLVRDLHAHLGDPGSEPLVASDLEIGVEPCPGPGSRHTGFQEAVKLVREACRALVELGATRIVLMTFHGSPLHSEALDEGVEECRRGGARAVAPLVSVLREMVELDDPSPFAEAFAHVPDEGIRREMLRRLPLDFHAGFFETSMALHYAPHSVASIHRDLPPCPEPTPDPRILAASTVAKRLGRDELARELIFAAAGRGWNALRPFPGYTSWPSFATGEAGAYFARYMVDRLAPMMRSVLEEGAEPPRPIMRWLRELTLGGRLPTMNVPLDQILRA